MTSGSGNGPAMDRQQPSSSSFILSFVLLSTKKKLLCLATFIFLSGLAINILFNTDDDELYGSEHMTRAKNRPPVDLSQIKEMTQNYQQKQQKQDQEKQDQEKQQQQQEYEVGDDTPTDNEAFYGASIIELRASVIESTLEEISSTVSLHEWTSPQGKAFQWIVNDDERMVHADDPHLIQRYALAVLYFALKGPNWHQDARWLSRVHECYWNRKNLGVMECNEDRYVTQLVLEENNLHGKLPPEIGLLGNLTSLSLQDNRISSFLPTAIEHLHDLTMLSLEHNTLSGPIPTELGQLLELTSLTLDHNEFSGSMPPSVCDLKTLYLLKADCDGDPPPVECECCTECCDGLDICNAHLNDSGTN